MTKISVKSIAKINFGLRILSKRKDGFHNLQTFFFPVKGLYDEIEFARSDKFYFKSNVALLNDGSNIIIKAIELLENKLGKKFNVDITLKKNIPIGAGLGGGSSNAASTLLTINKMFNLGLSFNKLIKFALQLGSDVPFFTNPVPSIGTSRGEILSPIDLDFHKYILLVNPGIHISTKEAFSNLNYLNPNEINYSSILTNNSINFNKAKTEIENDFEEYAFKKYPKISKIKNTLIDNGALFAQMSGTGSTVYGIFDNNEILYTMKKLFPNDYFFTMTAF